MAAFFKASLRVIILLLPFFGVLLVKIELPLISNWYAEFSD